MWYRFVVKKLGPKAGWKVGEEVVVWAGTPEVRYSNARKSICGELVNTTPKEPTDLGIVKTKGGSLLEFIGVEYTDREIGITPTTVLADTKPTNPKQAIGSTRAPFDLIPDGALAIVSMAFHEGATKYGAYNWRVAGVRASTYRAAAARHWAKWWNGDNVDPTTKVHHLANAIACGLIVLDAEISGMLNDDRPPKQDLESLFKKLQDVQAHLTELHKDCKVERHTEKNK